MIKRMMAVILLLGLVSQLGAASIQINPPDHVQLAALLMQGYAGEDGKLDKEEALGMLTFLQKNLPEETGQSNFSTFLSRQNNVYNAPRGDMTEERNAIRDRKPELYVDEFIKKYDKNADSVLNRRELTNAMLKLIGLPSSSSRLGKRSVANK